MNDNFDLKDHIDQAFDGEPMLPAATGRLRAGQRARRVRRTAVTGAVAVMTLVVGGASWAALDGTRATSDRGTGDVAVPSSPAPTTPSSAPSEKSAPKTDAEITRACRNAHHSSKTANRQFFDERGGRIAVKLGNEIYFEARDRSLYGWCLLDSDPIFTEMAVFRPPPESSSKGLPLTWDPPTFVTRLPGEVKKVEITYYDGFIHSAATKDGWIAMQHTLTKQTPRVEFIPFARIIYYGAGQSVLAEWVNSTMPELKRKTDAPDPGIYPAPNFRAQDRLNYNDGNYTD